MIKNDKNSVYDKVTEIVADVLRTPEVEMDMRFKDLGVDSISAIEIITSINNNFNLKLEAVTIYDYPTVKKLSDYILSIL